MLPQSPWHRLKQFIRKATWPAVLMENFAINRHSWLRRSGWVESVRRGYPCTSDGAPIPWMNYSIVRFLDERLTSDMTLFEFGSGYSTLFYSTRVRAVFSVEHDAAWHENIREHVPANVTCMLREVTSDDAYTDSISETGQRFDVIVIDGRRRVECLRTCLAHLTDNGVVIFDDTLRDKYQEGILHARSLGFRELAMIGLKPQSKRPGRTSILYRDGNCLGI